MGRPKVAKAKIKQEQGKPPQMRFHTSEIKSTYAAALAIDKFVLSDGTNEYTFDPINITPEESNPNNYCFAYVIPTTTPDGFDDELIRLYDLTIHYNSGSPATVTFAIAYVSEFDETAPAF